MSAKRTVTLETVFEAITQRFADLGQPVPGKWESGLPMGYKEITDEKLVTHICNKIFRDIMITFEQTTGTPTFEARILLRDEVSVNVWFNSMYNGIIPYLVQNGMMENL